MKKSFVKLLLSGAIVLAGFAFTGCNDLETEMNGLADRVTALENTVKDLQAKIDGGAVITSVDKTDNGVKVTLSDGSSFELTNGKDGANGTNGKDGANGTNGKDGAPGSVVTIGENGNWFIDGVDTGLAAEGKDGADGTNGTNGVDGKDGVYYYPNEDGFFHKVDGDTDTATEISWKAAGVTAVWTDGKLVISGADGMEEGEVVEIVLTSTLKSLAIVPETLLDSRAVIDFYNLYIPDTSEGADPMYDFIFVTSAPTYATYLVNPKNADLTNIAWNFVSYGVEVRSEDVASDLVSYVGEPMVTDKGLVNFALVANDKLPAWGDSKDLYLDKEPQVLVGLEATDEVTGEVITSDFAYAQEKAITSYQIINKKDWYGDVDPKDGKADELPHPYYMIYTPEWEAALEAGDLNASFVADQLIMNQYGYYVSLPMAYDKEFDFDDYLETYAWAIETVLPEIEINPTYKVTLPETFLGADGVTNQQKFVNLNTETNVVTVNPDYGTAAINRMPIFLVESQVENNEGELVTVAAAYIALEIVKEVVEPTPLEALEITLKGEFDYADLVRPGAFTEEMEGVIALDWETANKQIYKALGMSHDEFVETYNPGEEFETFHYDAEGELIESTGAWAATPVYSVIYAEDEYADITSTNVALVQVTWFVQENSEGRVDVVFKADGKRDVIVHFDYTVTHEHEWPAFNPDYIAGTEHNMTVIEVKGKLVNNAWALHSTLKEHFEEYLKDYQANGAHAELAFTLPYLSAPYTPIAVDATDEEKALGTAQADAAFVSGDEETVATDDIKLVNALTEEYEDVVVTMYEALMNGNICEKSYVVRFSNPFTIVVGDIELETYLAEHDTKDIKKYVKIYDHATDRTAAHLIWDGSKSPEEQNAAKPYKLGTITLGDYDLVFDATTDTEASFGDNLTIIETSKVDWYNDGALLQYDKKAKYSVTVTIPGICETEAVGNIKVNKTK